MRTGLRIANLCNSAEKFIKGIKYIKICGRIFLYCDDDDDDDDNNMGNIYASPTENAPVPVLAPKKKILIFGSTGNIGTALFDYYKSRDDVDVYRGFCTEYKNRASNQAEKIFDGHIEDVLTTEYRRIRELYKYDKCFCIHQHAICMFDTQYTAKIHTGDSICGNLRDCDKFDGIVWCQGKNINDNITKFDSAEFSSIIDANVTFILFTLSALLKKNAINNSADLIIISSIWETNVRPNKLSYSISKAALGSLVKSAAHELSCGGGIKINNILPGIVDNEMTRKTVNEATLAEVAKMTGFNRLVNMTDIINTANFLLFNNTGISGQSIKIDLGMTNMTML